MTTHSKRQPDLMAALEDSLRALRCGRSRPPSDPRNCWRVIDQLGVSREVASEGNARQKAAGYDRVCPARECPHRVQHWTGWEWIDA